MSSLTLFNSVKLEFLVLLCYIMHYYHYHYHYYHYRYHSLYIIIIVICT